MSRNQRHHEKQLRDICFFHPTFFIGNRLCLYMNDTCLDCICRSYLYLFFNHWLLGEKSQPEVSQFWQFCKTNLIQGQFTQYGWQQNKTVTNWPCGQWLCLHFLFSIVKIKQKLRMLWLSKVGKFLENLHGRYFSVKMCKK